MVLVPLVATVLTSRVQFAPFGECLRLSNGEVDLVISPKVGRAVFFGKTGDENVLWLNPSPVAKKGEWMNWGGDKVWPAPQSDWNWPPDPALDGSTHRARFLPDGGIELTSPTSPKTGLRIVRTFRMHPLGHEVAIVTRLLNRSRRTQRLAAWQIAQTPVGKGVRMPSYGFRAYPGTTVDQRYVSSLGEWIGLESGMETSGKFGAKGASGTLKWIGDETVFTMRHRLEAGEYPDNDLAQQVYRSVAPPYFELELTAPLRDVPPGGESRLETLWSVEDRTDGEDD